MKNTFRRLTVLVLLAVLLCGVALPLNSHAESDELRYFVPFYIGDDISGFAVLLREGTDVYAFTPYISGMENALVQFVTLADESLYVGVFGGTSDDGALAIWSVGSIDPNNSSVLNMGEAKVGENVSVYFFDIGHSQLTAMRGQVSSYLGYQSPYNFYELNDAISGLPLAPVINSQGACVGIWVGNNVFVDFWNDQTSGGGQQPAQPQQPTEPQQQPTQPSTPPTMPATEPHSMPTNPVLKRDVVEVKSSNTTTIVLIVVIVLVALAVIVLLVVLLIRNKKPAAAPMPVNNGPMFPIDGAGGGAFAANAPPAYMPPVTPAQPFTPQPYLPTEPARTMRIVGDDGIMTGREFIVGNQPVTIGRGNPSLVINYPADTRGVSHKHAVVKMENGRLYLTDVGSSYGTYLHGVQGKLEPNRPYELNVGSSFYIAEKKNKFTVRE